MQAGMIKSLLTPGEARRQAQWGSQDSAAGAVGIQESCEDAECSLRPTAAESDKYWAGGRQHGSRKALQLILSFSWKSTANYSG